MGKTMWRWSTYSKDTINGFEVVKETGKQITFLEPRWDGNGFSKVREYKESLDHAWFDTWEAAHEHWVNTLVLRMEQQERDLADTVKELWRVKAIQKPAGEEEV